MCASSTTAFISSRVICCAPGSVLRENTPPVAQILMTCAPYLRSRAHAAPAVLVGVGVEGILLLHRRREIGGVAMAAGRAEAVGRADDARTLDLAFLDRLAQADVVPGIGADVPHRGEAGLQRLHRVRHREHRPEAIVELEAGVAAVRRIAIEVHVHVDEAGQQGHAGQIEAPRRGRDLNLGSRSRRGDAAIADDHDRLLDDFARRDVDQPIGADRDDLGIHGGGPGEGGQQQGCEQHGYA